MQEDNYFIQNRQYITGLESLFIQASQKLVGAWIKKRFSPRDIQAISDKTVTAPLLLL